MVLKGIVKNAFFCYNLNEIEGEVHEIK